MAVEEQDMRELASFIRENKSALIQNSLDTFARVFPHKDRTVLSSEELEHWTAVELDGFAYALETGDTSKQNYEFFFGDLITQASPEFLTLNNFMESRLNLTKVIVAFIWQRLSFDPERALELMLAFESLYFRIVKENLALYQEKELVPGSLLKYMQLTRPSGTVSDGQETGTEPSEPEISSQNEPVYARPSDRSSLTPREEKILDLIAKGKTNKEIAMICGIRVATVKNHVSHILTKLHLHNRTELALYAAHGD